MSVKEAQSRKDSLRWSGDGSAEQNRTVQVQGRKDRGEKVSLFPRHNLYSANTPSEHTRSPRPDTPALSNLLSISGTLLHDKHDLSGFVRRGLGCCTKKKKINYDAES